MNTYLFVSDKKWTLIHWCKNQYIRILGHSAMHWAITKCLLPKMDNGNNTTQSLVSLGFASGTNFTLGIIPLLFWKDNVSLLWLKPTKVNLRNLKIWGLLGLQLFLLLNGLLKTEIMEILLTIWSRLWVIQGRGSLKYVFALSYMMNHKQKYDLVMQKE